MNDANVNNKWIPDIILALRASDGTARFPEIYHWIELNRFSLPKEWKAAIRATIYQNSSDSPVHKKGNLDIFYKKGYGLCSLRHPTDNIIGKTDRDLYLQVLSGMSIEMLKSFAGNGDAMMEYAKTEIEKLKKRYNLKLDS